MHEFSIAQNIVNAIRTELKKVKPAPKRLKKARIVAGQYHQLIPENLQFAYEILIKDSPLAGSVLVIDSRPIVGVCGQCKQRTEIRGAAFLCGKCGSTSIELVEGRELYLDSLEVESK